MEPTITERIAEFCGAIRRAVKDERNSAVFRVTTCGGIIYGWHISDLPIGVWLKVFGAIFAIVIAPALGILLKEFMHDLYQLEIKPRIFKNKK